jgi:hypothetical protein
MFLLTYSVKVKAVFGGAYMTLILIKSMKRIYTRVTNNLTKLSAITSIIFNGGDQHMALVEIFHH